MSTSCCRDDRCSAIQHLYLPQACWNYGLPCLKQGCATTVTTDSQFGGGLQSGLQALTFTSHKTMSRLVAARSLPTGQAGHAQLQRPVPRAPGPAAAHQPLPRPLQPAGFSAALVPRAQVRPSWDLPARGASCCLDFLDGFRSPMLPLHHSKKRKSFTSYALGA